MQNPKKKKYNIKKPLPSPYPAQSVHYTASHRSQLSLSLSLSLCSIANTFLMDAIWRAIGSGPNPEDYSGIEFWSNPERVGWLMKQGEYIKTWRRRWFVLKQGKLLWFKDSDVTRSAVPRGVIPVGRCLTVKGAEDVINKPYAFEISTGGGYTMFFIADSEKEKEEWINSIGRSIVQHSRSVTDSEIVDYDNQR